MPLLSLFAPLPLAIMIPFMAAQSFAMGEAFGKGFQSGKRRVSSMTNEQFNSTSQVQMFQETTADINGMIPAMKAQMTKFTMLQSDVIKELVEYAKKLPRDIFEGLASTGGATTDPNTEFLHALGIGASGLVSPNTSEASAIQGALLGAVNTPSPTTGILADWLKLLQVQQTNTMKSAEANANAKLLADLQAQISTITAQNPPTQTFENPNIGKITEVNNIRTVYNNKGQITSQNIINPSLVKGTPAKTVVRYTDNRQRPPKSIVTQWNKLNEEIRAYDRTIQLNSQRRGMAASRENLNHIKNRATAVAKKMQLKLKYKLGKDPRAP